MNKTYDEELLQRVENYLTSSGMSQNKMAQAVGLSQTALSNWRRQIYHGDPVYVEGKLREYFETQAAREAVEEQAAPYLPDTGYVPTTVSEDIYKGIKFAQLERGMVVLHGDAGIGKTEGARKFLHDYPHSTVFITATPTTGSLGCIIKLLARALGVPDMRGRMDMMLAIRDKLAGTNKVVIIDEAQHLRLPALEELRGLSDADAVTGTPGNGVCLIGNTEVYSRMMGRQQAQFAQLFSRIKMNRSYSTQKVKKEDIRALFPRLAAENRTKELDFLLGIAKGRWGVRGAKTVYNNSVRNENITYDGLYSMAVHLGVGWN